MIKRHAYGIPVLITALLSGCATERWMPDAVVFRTSCAWEYEDTFADGHTELLGQPRLVVGGRGQGGCARFDRVPYQLRSSLKEGQTYSFTILPPYQYMNVYFDKRLLAVHQDGKLVWQTRNWPTGREPVSPPYPLRQCGAAAPTELLPVALGAIARHAPQIPMAMLSHGTTYYEADQYLGVRDAKFRVILYASDSHQPSSSTSRISMVEVVLRDGESVNASDVRIFGPYSATSMIHRVSHMLASDWIESVGCTEGPVQVRSALTQNQERTLVQLAVNAVSEGLPDIDLGVPEVAHFSVSHETWAEGGASNEYRAVDFWLPDSIRTTTNAEGMVTITGVQIGCIFEPDDTCILSESDVELEMIGRKEIRLLRSSGPLTSLKSPAQLREERMEWLRDQEKSGSNWSTEAGRGE